MPDALKFSPEQKSAAFEWLRDYASRHIDEPRATCALIAWHEETEIRKKLVQIISELHKDLLE